MKTDLDAHRSPVHEACHAVFATREGLVVDVVRVPNGNDGGGETLYQLPTEYGVPTRRATEAACMALVAPVILHDETHGTGDGTTGLTGCVDDREQFNRLLQRHTGNEPEEMKFLAGIALAHVRAELPCLLGLIREVAELLEIHGELTGQDVVDCFDRAGLRRRDASKPLPDFRQVP